MVSHDRRVIKAAEDFVDVCSLIRRKKDTHRLQFISSNQRVNVFCSCLHWPDPGAEPEKHEDMTSAKRAFHEHVRRATA